MWSKSYFEVFLDMQTAYTQILSSGMDEEGPFDAQMVYTRTSVCQNVDDGLPAVSTWAADGCRTATLSGSAIPTGCLPAWLRAAGRRGRGESCVHASKQEDMTGHK